MANIDFQCEEGGALQIGIRLSGRTVRTYPLCDESGYAKAPINFRTLLSYNKIINSDIEITSHVRIKTNTLFMYFGFSDILDQDFLVRLDGEDGDRNGFNKWTTSSRTNKTFQEFAAGFWGIGKMRFCILDDSNKMLHETIGKPFFREILVDFDRNRSLICQKIITQLGDINQKASFSSPIYSKIYLDKTIGILFNSLNSSKGIKVLINAKKFLPQLLILLRLIIKKPIYKTKIDQHHFNLNEHEPIPQFLKSNTSRVFNATSYKKVNSRIYPLSFDTINVTECANIYENQLIITETINLLNKLRDVNLLLSSYITTLDGSKRQIRSIAPSRSIHVKKMTYDITRHENLFSEVQVQIESLNRMAYQMKQSFGINNIPKAITTGANINKIAYDNRYKSAIKIFKNIQKELTRPQGSMDIYFQIGPFNSLYQYWCLLEIVNALSQIGFEVENYNLDEFYNRAIEGKIFCQLKHTQIHHLKLDLCFEKVYPQKSRTNDMNYGVYDIRSNQPPNAVLKDRPDISLEFWHPTFFNHNYPLIITLDPTISTGYRIESLEKKHEYLNSIFIFDPAYWDRRGYPRGNVVAAWAIYPGNNSNPDLEEPYGNPRFGDSSLYSKGNIVLTPNQNSHLTTTLKSIIDFTIILPNNL